MVGKLGCRTLVLFKGAGFRLNPEAVAESYKGETPVWP